MATESEAMAWRGGDGIGRRTHRVWIHPTYDTGHAIRRTFLVTTLTAFFAWLCLHANLGLLALIACGVGLWPYRYRIEITEGSIVVRWLVLADSIPASAFVGTELIEDERTWAVGRRGFVLQVSRRSARPMVLFADIGTLERMATDVHELIASNKLDP